MKGKLCTLLAVGIMAATALTATAATKHYPRNIVSQSPSDSPALAQANSEAMFLRSTDYDRSLLYIEANNGSTLDVLDVTDPAKISRVAQLSLAAHAAFDFTVATDDGVLLRYRDNSGQAYLSLKNPKQPNLITSAAFNNTTTAEDFDGAIVLSTAPDLAPGPIDPSYEVFDNSASGRPALIATVPGVIQKVEQDSTGTLFLLTSDGVTVIRQPQIEQQNAINVMWKQSTN